MLNSTWRYWLRVSIVFCSGNKLEEGRGAISYNCLLPPYLSGEYRSKKSALENGESFNFQAFWFHVHFLSINPLFFKLADIWNSVIKCGKIITLEMNIILRPEMWSSAKGHFKLGHRYFKLLLSENVHVIRFPINSDLGILWTVGHIQPFSCPCSVHDRVALHNGPSFSCGPLGKWIAQPSLSPFRQSGNECNHTILNSVPSRDFHLNFK